MKTEIITIRVPVGDKEYFNSKAKRKGYSLSEYSKKALYNMDKQNGDLIFDRAEFVSKYANLKAEMELIENKECRLAVKKGLEELVCLILN